MMLDADEAAGIGRIAKAGGFHAIDLDANQVFDTCHLVAIPAVAVEHVTNPGLGEEGL